MWLNTIVENEENEVSMKICYRKKSEQRSGLKSPEIASQLWYNCKAPNDPHVIPVWWIQSNIILVHIRTQSYSIATKSGHCCQKYGKLNCFKINIGKQKFYTWIAGQNCNKISLERYTFDQRTWNPKMQFLWQHHNF